MNYGTNNIVIVGGGSAGWMSAATLISQFPNKNITVIESPRVPTVGVGEATVQLFRAWMHLVGIDERNFMRGSDATYKMSIKFNDFYKKGDGGYHYPFGKVHYPPGSRELGLRSWWIKKSFYPETPVQDYCRTFFPQMPLIEKGKFSKNLKGEFGRFSSKNSTAFHMDAVKFANWLRDDFCLPKGVNHLIGLVEVVNVDDSGIVNLILENGDIVEGDLYIDCTGFKSLLLGNALQEPFISYEDKLPNNKAWAVRIEYKDREQQLKNYTNCTALGNGWVWETPTWSRIGTGYVYCDKYVTKEDALLEFKEHLSKSFGEDDIDDSRFREIDMKVGIHERIWVKNVVAIGLSAGFIEPLESNGLYTIHEFLIPLIRFLGKDYISRYDQDMYNRLTIQTFDNFAQFVSLHYALSSRRDTDYWKDISKKCFDEKVYKRLPNLETGGFSEFSDRHLHLKDHNPEHGIHCIAAGNNYFPIDTSSIKIQEFHDGIDYKKLIDECIPLWEEMKNYTSSEADKCSSVYNYLKEEIFNMS